MSRLGRSQPVQPTAWHGFVDPGPGPVGTTPPPVQVVPLDDRRQRLPTPAPFVTSGALLPVTAPTVRVPAPLVSERPDQRDRFRPLNASVLSGALALPVAPAATPPAPFVVPVDARGRFLVVLPSTGQHGFVDPGPGPVGTTPPPTVSIDRIDQRVRYRPLDPVVLGFVGTVIPPPPVVDPGHSSGASPTQTISPHRGKQLADDWQLRRDQDEIALIIALLD